MVTEQPLVRPEYSRVIAQKQILAFINMLKNRADDKLKKVIQRSDIDKKQYGRVDDIISYLKEEAAKSSISPDAIDKLALKVAVMDNVLTQASVDLIARNTRGELKEILSNLNIYDAGLKTWTDLQQYISDRSNGRIQPVDFNKIAADILSDIDTSISKIRKKILAYSDKAVNGSLIKQSVNTTDRKNLKNAGVWMQSVYNESIKSKVKDSEMDDMLSKISALPNTEAGKYIEELSGYSDDKLRDYLHGPAFKKAGIKTPNDVLFNLFKNKDKGFFPEMSLFDALVNHITAKDIPIETIASQTMIIVENNLWIMWVAIGAGLLIFFIVLSRRKKKEKKDKKE